MWGRKTIGKIDAYITAGLKILCSIVRVLTVSWLLALRLVPAANLYQAPGIELTPGLELALLSAP
jgi:hypothetical protein